MKKLFAFAILALAAFGVQAQSLKVATGSAKGTYSRMQKELNAHCGNVIPMVEQTTSGAVENASLIMENQVNAAWMQTDIMYFKARTEDMSGLKTLFAAHPEEVHIIASTKVYKQGGTMGFGGKEFTLNTLNDLAGRKVAASGGSYITAQVIRLQGEVNFQLVELQSLEAILAAIKAGTIDAGIVVGGAPMDSFKTIGAGYKLLSVPEATVAKLKGVYRPARVTYNNLGAAGVQTVATDALFVTREYKTEKFNTALSKLRACLNSNLDELKETTGMHPKWQQVDATNKGKWAYLELKK